MVRPLPLLAALGLFAQTSGVDIPITSVDFRIEQKTVDSTIWQIQNTRDVALMAWAVRIGSSTIASNFAGQPGTFTAGTGPVGAHETRDLRPLAATETGSPSVLLAVFEDGWVEGTSDYVDNWVRIRDARANDAAAWIDTLTQAQSRSVADARALLADAIVKRRQARAMSVNSRPGGLIGLEPTEFSANIQSVVSEPDSWTFVDRLAGVLQQLRTERARWTEPEHLAPAPAGQPDPVQSVIARAAVAPVSKTFGTIENRRDVAIEAYGYLRFDSPEQKSPSGGFRSEGSLVLPHQLRTIEVFDGPVTPSIKLEYVIFSDLSFEGSRTAVDQVFRQREQRADEYAFWIAALAEARSKAPADVRAFLTRKLHERITSTANDQAGIASEALQIADIVDRTPDRLVAAIDAMRGHMEESRAQLTRHLRR